jgi:type I restriction enzyme M protein
MDQGALFRSNSEKVIRQKIVDEKLLDSVILLPEKIFYNTGAAGVILIFNKEKQEEYKDKVLFIDASREYGKHPDMRKLNIITNDNIKHIVSAYKNFESIDGFSKVVSVDEIKAKDYNLNVTTFVSPINNESSIDITGTIEELNGINADLSEVEEKLNGYLKELGYID